MLQPKDIAEKLAENKSVFKSLLQGVSQKEYSWKPSEDKWCILEVLCHLLDEEKEDFRTRCRQVLEEPEKKLPAIDPQGWVLKRQYISQDYNTVLDGFLKERSESLQWLDEHISSNWSNTYQHPKFGPMPARLFLHSWLAHDFLHIRQIVRLKYQYLEEYSEPPLRYAGKW